MNNEKPKFALTIQLQRKIQDAGLADELGYEVNEWIESDIMPLLENTRAPSDLRERVEAAVNKFTHRGWCAVILRDNAKEGEEMCDCELYEQKKKILSLLPEHSTEKPDVLAEVEVVKEIIDLVGQLDDFCIGQFKKLLGHYVDSAYNLKEYPDEDKQEFCATLVLNIKLDLENYISQLRAHRKG